MPGSNSLHRLPNLHKGADPDSDPNTRNACIIKTSGCLPAPFPPPIIRLGVITSVCCFSGIQGHRAVHYHEAPIPHYHFGYQLHIDSCVSSG